MIGALEARARRLGVEIDTGHPVDALPDRAGDRRHRAGPGPGAARRRLARAGPPGTPSASTSASSIAVVTLHRLRPRRGRLGRALQRARLLPGPGRRGAGAGADADPARRERRPGGRCGWSACSTHRCPDRAERQTWHRRQVMEGRTGPLDHPGKTWRDRPAVDRGDGVYLAGDMVAAPGLLSEVAWASGVEAGRLAAASAALGSGSCPSAWRSPVVDIAAFG